MPDSDLTTVYKVAELARLDIHEAEARALAAQFARTLEHFRVLAQLDVEGVEPMTVGTVGTVGTGGTSGTGGTVGAAGTGVQLRDVQRDDVPVPSLPLERILANAPARVDGFYSVPKTVGGDE